MSTLQPVLPDESPRDRWRLSARAHQVKPSVILGLNARAKALIAQGRDVVLFGAGEPDFETPAHIRIATTAALERGVTRYTPTNGIPELREAISARLAAQGLPTPPADIIVTAGAKMALYEVFQAICDPGDEVILFSPYWSSYAEIILLAGARPVFVPTLERDGFQPDPELLRRALTPRTRALLLNSPGNPTGAVYPRETLQQLARVIEDTDVLVISDDIYEKILFDRRAFANVAQLGPDWQSRTVIVNGVSKTYAMTGFRIGWASGPREIIAAMGRIQDQSTSCPTAFAQSGALAALTGPQDSVPRMSAEFERRRDAMVKGLRAMPGVTCAEPGGAFYAFPSVAGLLGKRFGGQVIGTPTALSGMLLDHFGVALVPGELFGAPEHLRLSFATSLEQIVHGLARMREAFTALTA
jgi:aspartate aminotransferase